ncbi:zonadhesin-like [Arctopsyche grandis]|uniref:zonadhesin-like n=1 Tax=Arctopsyche grandis TaxID=121162 RepID=UPI00406D8ECE
MFKFIALALLIVAANCTSPQRCSKNEVYTDCVGCENTCARPDRAATCRVICSPGCVCIRGYFRNSKNICVPAKQCDSCKMFEEFSICGNTNCVDTCAFPDRSKNCKPERCIAGCICQKGHLKNKQNQCVKPEFCDLTCGPNQQISLCGDSCRLTCGNKDEPLVCNTDCGPPACACKAGFVRDWNENCIKPEECPTCSGPNEFFSCGLPCDTECATLGDECPNNSFKCVERCYCKNGFARNSKNVCIPIKDCPPRQCPTDPNAIIVNCGDPCPLTCENKDDVGPRPCPEICILNGCKCKDGYVLGRDKKCIPAKSCPPISKECKKNEVFNSRVPSCPPEKTCLAYLKGFTDDCPPEVQYKPGCVCKDGHIRNDNNECVLPAQCCSDPDSILVPEPNPCKGGTCASPQFEKCDLGADPFGCQCKKGYVKKSENDPTCIPLKFCGYPK